MTATKGMTAAIAASAVSLLGTAFLGISTFAYLAGMTPVFLIAAVPGFLGWIFPFFLYQKMKASRERAIAPKIEEQHETIYGICKSGSELLHASR